MSFQDSLVFDYVKPEQLEEAHRIELTGFSLDEAASLETFIYRQNVSPNLFLGCYIRASSNDTRPSSDYTQSSQDYNRPLPNYNQPYPDYNRPSPDYNRPSPDYNRPSPDYSRPSPDYSRPLPNYTQPLPNYTQPLPNYTKPLPNYTKPLPDYNRPSPDYGQPTTDSTSSPLQLIGYICGLLGPTPYDTQCMSRQDLAGNAICIHSVCVDPEYQGKGVAKAIMTEYIRRAKESGQQERILLICHENLVDFYKRVGLKWRAKSESNHGGYSQWQEMGLELK